jgi:hypothetical protein
LVYCILNNGFTYYIFEIAKYKERFRIYDVFGIIELGCFLFFIKQIIKNKRIAKYLPLVFILFLSFNIIEYLFLSKKESFNSIASGIEAILIIILCLNYFYEQLKEANTLLIYTTHNFWIVIAFLIFFSGTFFLYIYTENTLQDKAFQNQYLIINSAFYLLKSILFSIAMLMKPQSEIEVNFPDESHISDWNHTRSFKNVN